MSDGIDAPQRYARGWLPPIGLLLSAVVLLPTVGMAALATASASAQWTQRSGAATMSHDAAEMDRLIVLRGEVTAEYVNAASISTAADLGLGTSRLSALYHVDFAAEARAARSRVDADTTASTFPSLQRDLTSLAALRAEIDAGRAHFSAVFALFTRLDTDIDVLWQNRLDAARSLAGTATRGVGSVNEQLSALQATFTAFQTAFERTRLTNALLTGKNTPTNVKALIAANTRFSAAVAEFTGHLGPNAEAAWRNLQADPAGRQFDGVVDRTVKAGIASGRAPLATNPTAYGAALIAAGKWVVDLTFVNAAASIDLGTLARHLEASAARSFLVGIISVAIATALAAVAAVLTARAVARPARRLAASARRISNGEFSIPSLPLEGARELAETSRALNEMTATLTALEHYAVTLAEHPRSSRLNQPLPGRTGRALQLTLDHLRDSVHERERDRLALQEAVTHDGLTGLLNRDAALDAITRDLARSRRESTRLMILFVDLDAFKRINDTYGHDVGDEALRITANALRTATRGSDIIARLGGDEFLVSGFASGRAEVESVAERVHDAIAAQALAIGGERVTINSSIGMALAESEDTAESFVREADLALYRAKRGGRNQIAWHDPLAHTNP
jgi:diguanylate cyclase (GGDEF)-like protein